MSVDQGWKLDAGTGLVLLAVSSFLFLSQGIGLNWDSNYFLLFSQSMRLHHNLSTQGLYAPLYPMILATLTSLGASTELAMVLVQSASLGVIFFCSSRLAREAGIPFPFAPIAGLLAALVGFGSVIFQFAGTEAPYSALLMACILIGVGSWRGSLPPSIWWFLPLGLLAPLSYIGIFAMALLAGLMAWRLRIANDSTPALVGALALAFGPIVLLAVVNTLAWDCPFGCHDASTVTLGANLKLTWSTLHSDAPQFAAGVLILIAALVAGLFSRRVAGVTVPDTTGDKGPGWLVWAIPLGMALVSMIIQIIASSVSDVEPINSRSFAALYPALVVAMIIAAWRIASRHSVAVNRQVFQTALVVMAVVVGYRDFSLYAALADDATDPEASLSEFGFKHSPMFQLWQDSQSSLLAEDHAGSIVTYYPLGDDSINPSGYLVLDSAYSPKAAKCRPGSIQLLEGGAVQIRLNCMNARGATQVNVAAISDPARVPKDTELLILDKGDTDDSAKKLPDFGSDNFRALADNPTHRIMSRASGSPNPAHG